MVPQVKKTTKHGKISQNILVNQIQQYTKNIIHPEDLSQWYQMVQHTWINNNNVSHEQKEAKNIMTSINTIKVFNETQHLLWSN